MLVVAELGANKVGDFKVRSKSNCCDYETAVFALKLKDFALGSKAVE